MKNDASGGEEAVLTVQEASRLLRVSPNTGYDYIARGLIPHLRLGGRIVIPRARFEAWLAGAEVEAPAAR